MANQEQWQSMSSTILNSTIPLTLHNRLMLTVKGAVEEMKAKAGVLKRWMIQDAARKWIPQLESKINEMSEDELRTKLEELETNMKQALAGGEMTLPEDADPMLQGMAAGDLKELAEWVLERLQGVLHVE